MGTRHELCSFDFDNLFVNTRHRVFEGIWITVLKELESVIFKCFLDIKESQFVLELAFTIWAAFLFVSELVRHFGI